MTTCSIGSTMIYEWSMVNRMYSELLQVKLNLSQNKIINFCRRHHIRRLSLFGSILHGDFGPDSDIDVLVEFEPDYVPGLAFFTMEAELSQILGQKVDLNTPQFLSRYFRNKVKAEAVVLYEQTR